MVHTGIVEQASECMEGTSIRYMLLTGAQDGTLTISRNHLGKLQWHETSVCNNRTAHERRATLLRPGVVLLSDSLAMTPAPGVDPMGPSPTERWEATLGTRSPAEGCTERRGKDCTFRKCCEGAGYCRQNKDGDKVCR